MLLYLGGSIRFPRHSVDSSDGTSIPRYDFICALSHYIYAIARISRSIFLQFGCIINWTFVCCSAPTYCLSTRLGNDMHFLLHTRGRNQGFTQDHPLGEGPKCIPLPVGTSSSCHSAKVFFHVHLASQQRIWLY